MAKDTGIQDFFNKERNISIEKGKELMKAEDQKKLENIANMMNITKDEIEKLSEEEKQELVDNIEYSEF